MQASAFRRHYPFDSSNTRATRGMDQYNLQTCRTVGSNSSQKYVHLLQTRRYLGDILTQVFACTQAIFLSKLSVAQTQAARQLEASIT